MRNNQAGFGGGAIVFILVILSLTGFTYYRVQQADENIDTYSSVDSFEECVAAGNPVMESYPEQCAANGTTYSNPTQKIDEVSAEASQLVLSELGVQFDVPPELSSLYYYQDPTVPNAVYFSLQELKETDCAADKVSVAALARYTMEELSERDPADLDELPYINGYYYIFERPQAMCSESPTIQQKADDTRTALEEAIERSLRAAQ